MLPYPDYIKQFARDLRTQSTKSEIKLWQRIQNKQLGQLRFLRQKPIGAYIADFYCAQAKLAIELDGFSHHFQQTIQKDICKEQYLNSIDVALLRFSDDEVRDDIENVLVEIFHTAQQRISLLRK